MVEEIKTKAEFDAKLGEAGKLIVVDFFATWCGPCVMIAPKVKEMSEKYQDVLFLKVDVDENEETAAFCKISAMPTFHFYKDGDKVDELVGASEEKLRALVEKHK